MFSPCAGIVKSGTIQGRWAWMMAVAACSIVSAVVFIATHRPEYRDMAQPARPRSITSCTLEGLRMGMNTLSNTCSVWCG